MSVRSQGTPGRVQLQGEAPAGANPEHDDSSDGAKPEAWVYLLRCGDGSLYTGWTINVPARLARHQAGRGGRYTASRLPVELVLVIRMPDRTAARQEEVRIKRLSRQQKLALVRAEHHLPAEDPCSQAWSC